jgi:all-trans-8'-apo-beta-carotenal 15,15'-oxygenase
MSKFRQELFSRSLPREHSFEPLRVEGDLPSSLQGTLYRNGPGIYEQFGVRYDHPFEGEGVISAVRIKEGAATGAARVVMNKGLEEERAAKKILYGGAAPWWRRMKNLLTQQDKLSPNTNVIAWQGKLLALNEGGKPVALDLDLNTVGEANLDGALKSAFSAHPHRVASQKTTYNIGLEYGPKTRLHFYALPDEGAAKNLGSLPLPFPTLVHDFAMTRDHFVLLVSPVKLRMARMLLQIGGFGDFFGWDGSLNTEIIVAPIADPTRAIRFSVPPFFQYHFANAFERDGKIFVDYVRYKDFTIFEKISVRDLGTSPGGQYHRGVIDLAKRSWTSSPLSSIEGEFPRVHPEIEGEEHSVTWLMRGDARAIMAVDTSSGKYVEHQLSDGQYASEPVFVAAGNKSERDGYVLTICHDSASDCGFLAVYDAAKIERGPISRVWFDHYLTSTFHGNWLAA